MLKVELLRPWKLATYAIGLALLVIGAVYEVAPDWDVPISIIMSLFAYLTAGWSMHVLVERQWKYYPLMFLATWWTVDGCYSLYWYLKDPAVLDFMRVANAPASLCLYWACGFVWYWNGSLAQLLAQISEIYTNSRKQIVR